MKIFERSVRISVVSLTIAAMMFLTGFSLRTLAAPTSKSFIFSNTEKHVQIKIEIHGHIDDHTVDSVEDLVTEWLEAAHFVVEHSEGADFLHLHISLDVSDDHHFKVHSDCGGWHEDKEAAVVDAIDEILHHMINDFIDKYSH